MGKVTTIGRTREYLLSRAERHRRAGRYDEAMALLWKAKNQFGLHEDIDMEMARVYTETGCEEEAARAYLRVVRLAGRHRPDALFYLSLAGAQHGDLPRAVSCFEQFMVSGQPIETDSETAAALGRQLLAEMEGPIAATRRMYARRLERRAAARLQEGKAYAALHLMRHAVRLHETARGATLLACCYLLLGQIDEAVKAASCAYRLAPGRVQTLCVLSDAYEAQGERALSRRALMLAAMRARTIDDLYATAMESAKHGEDRMTLRMTKKLLAREPYHTPGMRLRACALMNLGQRREASRLFGRLCGLLPEDSVCAYYYHLSKSGEPIHQRLTLGVEVPHEEGVRRAADLIAQLYVSPDEIGADAATLQRVCTLCSWAFRSALAGGHTKTVALILLTALSERPEAKQVLLDALTDAQLADSFKLQILKVLTAREGFQPYHVDMGGKLVRLAAGGVSTQNVSDVQANARAVQLASDALHDAEPDAPQRLLNLYLLYLKRYAQPRGREEDACAAALYALYPRGDGRQADPYDAARRFGVTRRLLGMMMRRLMRCMQQEPGTP